MEAEAPQMQILSYLKHVHVIWHAASSRSKKEKKIVDRKQKNRELRSRLPLSRKRVETNGGASRWMGHQWLAHGSLSFLLFQISRTGGLPVDHRENRPQKEHHGYEVTLKCFAGRCGEGGGLSADDQYFFRHETRSG